MRIIETPNEPGREPSPFPLLRCRNVFVLPGIPSLLQKKWQVRHPLCLPGALHAASPS